MSKQIQSRANVARYTLNKVKSQAKQVGGNHYQKYEIEPIEFITRNNIPFIEGNVIKYLVRWRDKGGIQDIEKCIHYLEMLKDLKNAE